MNEPLFAGKGKTVARVFLIIMLVLSIWVTSIRPTIASANKKIDIPEVEEQVADAVYNLKLIDEDEPEVEAVVTAEVPPTETVQEQTASTDGWQYYGVCTITHYCPCEICCGAYASGYTASGTLATAGRTVAMAGVPFGTQVMINGAVYTVEDRGVGSMWVDVFVGSHQEAIQRGIYQAEVYIR